METRNGGDVPRVIGKGARKETGCVIDEISDDYFNGLCVKLGERGQACR